MNQPLVSVVMITYNHEKYIEEAINGVLMQNYGGKIELILANDNSPDNTDALIQKKIAENSTTQNIEIKYTKHNPNKGMMPNFFWALEQVQGKYIALCEGDDYWTDPLKLQKQVDFLEANDKFAICFHAVKIQYEEGIAPFYRDVNIDTKEISSIDDLIKGNFIHTVSCVFRNTLPYPEWLIHAYPGDWPLHVINATKGDIYFDNNIMAVYRVHYGGVFSTTKRNVAKEIMTIKYLSGELKKMKFFTQSRILKKRYNKAAALEFGILGNIDTHQNIGRFKRAMFLLNGPIKMKIFFWIPIVFGSKSAKIWGIISHAKHKIRNLVK